MRIEFEDGWVFPKGDHLSIVLLARKEERRMLAQFGEAFRTEQRQVLDASRTSDGRERPDPAHTQ